MDKQNKKKESQKLIPRVDDVQLVTPQEMNELVKFETEKRKVITEYINSHFQEGIDFGKIEIQGRDGKKYTSKPCLFKAGSEKWCSLFHIRPTFKIDRETIERLEGARGLIAYICELKNYKGEVIGEGRGAALVSERPNWTINNAIKIAQKRAQIDAVLRTGSLSDFFTQDLEDMPLADKKEIPVVDIDDDGFVKEPFPDRKSPQRSTANNPVQYKCSDCGKEITKAEYDYSWDKYGMRLGRCCQIKYKQKK
jgi:hypothetical protein